MKGRMKKDRRYLVPSSIHLFLILLSMVSYSVQARGNQEIDKEFDAQLEKNYEQIIQGIDSGILSASEGKEQLAELRRQYNLEYNDEAGILDSTLDSLEERRITLDEARYSFSLMQRNRLMDYRQEENQRLRQYDRELVLAYEEIVHSAHPEDRGKTIIRNSIESYQRQMEFVSSEILQDIIRQIDRYETGEITLLDLQLHARELHLRVESRIRQEDWQRGDGENPSSNHNGSGTGGQNGGSNHGGGGGQRGKP